MDLALVEFKLAGDEWRTYYNLARFNSRGRSYQEDQRPYKKEDLTPSSPITQTRDSLEALEAVAKLPQPETPKGEDKDLNPSDPSPPEKSEIKEEILPIPSAAMKTRDEESSEMATHLSESSPKEPYEIGEMTYKEEAASIGEVKSETPIMDYVTWKRKSIGERAIELSNTKSDEEIVRILSKEYGEEQLHEWLGISMKK